MLLASALAAAGSATAQCATSYVGTLPLPNAFPFCIAALPNGDLVVGGAFTAIGGVSGNHVARWDGAAMQPLGAGTNNVVTDLAALPNGELIAVGGFTAPANGVARWNGSAWLPMGGLSGSVERVVVAPNGDIWVAGPFVGNVARWNGASWSVLGGTLASGIRGLTVDENSVVYVSTDQYLVLPVGVMFPGNVYRWSGTSWIDLGTTGSIGPGGYAAALAPRHGGGCHAAGVFQAIGGQAAPNFASWNGTAWLPANPALPNGTLALLTLPDGTSLVAGAFAPLLRWNGTVWGSFGVGLNDTGMDLALAPNGEVLVAGVFTQVGLSPANNTARLASNCPASASASGAPCVAAAGPMTLTASALPWLGATSRTRCTGFAATAIGLGVLGFSATSVPLAQILPVGSPGCDLLASPDVVATLLPAAGNVDFAVAIPIAPSIVGGTFHEQVVQVELSALQITGLVGSNALVLTIGQY